MDALKKYNITLCRYSQIVLRLRGIIKQLIDLFSKDQHTR